MSKRFTDANKWSDPWFTELSTSDKMLWLYILDTCNQIGVLDFSKKWADMATGTRTNIDEFAEASDGRVVKLKNGKYFIPKFLKYQNCKISIKSPAHKPIIKLMESSPELISQFVEILTDETLTHFKDNLPHTLCHSLYDRLQVRVRVPVEVEVGVEEEVGVDVEEATVDAVSKKIPSKEEFVKYLVDELPKLNPEWSAPRASRAASLQYETYIEAGWKDGFGNEIKVWKSKAKNAMANKKPWSFGPAHEIAAEGMTLMEKIELERQQGRGF